MKCSSLGLCLFLSFFFCSVPLILWPFDLIVLLLKTLIRIHDAFCAPHLISHNMLSWQFVKAYWGIKTALVCDFFYMCLNACFLVCLCLILSPYLCDPWSVHCCGFRLWIVLAKSSCLCYECNMNHMLIQIHTQSAIFQERQGLNLIWNDETLRIVD